MIRYLLCLLVLTGAATAQDRRPSHCIAIAQGAPGIEYVQHASFREPLSDFSVRISYIAHASFLIQAGQTDAVTDFTGFIGNVDLIPDVVTMNHAHETHWTANPDPAIPHVLPGWGDFGEGIDHHVDLGDMVIRNVSTDIRSAYGAGVEPNGNSIFVFEAEGLCIGHLGHLHHEPTDAQYAAIGRMDVVMAAVDGGMTLDLPTMMNVLRRLKASVIIPMHWFGDITLARFLAGMEGDFPIVNTGASQIELSLATLPDQPTIVVLQPRYLREAEE